MSTGYQLLQYLLSNACISNENICVVGDDAQSIYAFRGANIQNILNFQKDYPDVKILTAPNYPDRLRWSWMRPIRWLRIIRINWKKCFLGYEEGEKIKVSRAFSDNEEGKIVADQIIEEKSLKGLNIKILLFCIVPTPNPGQWRRPCAKLISPIKYTVVLLSINGKKIKDLIAYFRLTFNPNDEEALKRVINYPRRGIGDTTIEKIMIAADQNQYRIWLLLQMQPSF